MDTEGVRAVLYRYAGAAEVREVRTFSFIRKGNEVTVHVRDSGVEGDLFRFSLKVVQVGREVGRGNGAPSVGIAVAIFHWSALDS